MNFTESEEKKETKFSRLRKFDCGKSLANIFYKYRSCRPEAFCKNDIGYISTGLTLSCRRSISYRNQSIDLFCKSINWFLYDMDLRHKINNNKLVIKFFDVYLSSGCKFRQPFDFTLYFLRNPICVHIHKRVCLKRHFRNEAQDFSQKWAFSSKSKEHLCREVFLGQIEQDVTKRIWCIPIYLRSNGRL